MIPRSLHSPVHDKQLNEDLGSAVIPRKTYLFQIWRLPCSFLNPDQMIKTEQSQF